MTVFGSKVLKAYKCDITVIRCSAIGGGGGGGRGYVHVYGYNVHVCLHTVSILYVLYNAIVREVITSDRSVQLWYYLVGILIIDQGLYL